MESPEQTEPNAEVVENPLLELLAAYKVAHASLTKAFNNLLNYYLAQIDYHLKNGDESLAWEVVRSIPKNQMQSVAAQYIVNSRKN